MYSGSRKATTALRLCTVIVQCKDPCGPGRYADAGPEHSDLAEQFHAGGADVQRLPGDGLHVRLECAHDAVDGVVADLFSGASLAPGVFTPGAGAVVPGTPPLLASLPLPV